MAKRKREGRPPGRQPPIRGSHQEEAGDRRRWVGLVAAAAAVIGYFTLLRLLAPNPWDYDEYFHVGLARELRGGMPASFRWTRSPWRSSGSRTRSCCSTSCSCRSPASRSSARR